MICIGSDVGLMIRQNAQPDGAFTSNTCSQGRVLRPDGDKPARPNDLAGVGWCLASTAWETASMSAPRDINHFSVLSCRPVPDTP